MYFKKKKAEPLKKRDKEPRRWPKQWNKPIKG